uniref:CRAL-TRIO domain-containing protein YKL091C-like n=1 Tax=Erigeron canadensis TaxID=72917 RepID=UPI001CB971ED|nr:CRAL-TRIO domain-containing protein YKL091C-like [Erigeron canadensis]
MEGKEVMTKDNGETKGISSSAVQNNYGSSEEEHEKILQMRDLVEKQDPTSKEYDDLTIRRFLRARDLNIDKACAMFLKYLKWRRTFVPNGSISVSEIPNNIAQNKMFMQGTDKSGRLIAVVLSGKHYPNKAGGLEEFKRYVVFALERILSRMPAGQEKFMVIADIQGWGYSNSDYRGYCAVVSILQDYYPERLGKMFVVHVPSIFMAAWKMVYPFIDEKTKKKIFFVDNKHLKSTLLKDIDESQLPEIYGGKLKLVPIQDS